MKKASDHVEAARKLVGPTAEDFVHSAADRVGPLAQSAADRVGPIAEAAADAFGQAVDLVSPYAHAAAELVSPYAHAAADRLTPLAHTAADRVGPLAGQARDAVSPYAQQAAAAVSPYAATAVGAVGPLAHQAAERLTPLADMAKQRGTQAAHDAADRFGPALGDARDKVGPAVGSAVGSARDKVSDNLLPKLSTAITAAAGTPLVTEAVSRGQATLAAARGDLSLPPAKKKGGWFKRLAIVGAVAGVAYVLARKFLGSKDSDWQAARPSTPYAPPKPAASTSATSTSTTGVDPSATEADAGDDPQSGPSAHADYLEANGEAEPDQPAEGGQPEADPVVEAEVDTVAPGADAATLEPVSDQLSEPSFAEPEMESDPTVLIQPVASDPAAADTTESGQVTEAGDDTIEIAAVGISGEGVYQGSQPPEGFEIKGNERSMKYHLPGSAGYVRTIAEYWFVSEEAAEAAGFVRAQR